MHIKYLAFNIALLISITVSAQDFDIYPRLKDDNVIMPELYENTLFSEYQIMSRNIRMMDMSYAMLVPGYIHFKAKDKTMGFVVLGTRLAGYAAIAGVILKTNNDYSVLNDFLKVNHSYKTKTYIVVSSLTLIVSSYFFDWVHGKYRLEKKQELIRYKYSVKFKMDELSNYENKKFQSLGLSLNVNF